MTVSSWPGEWTEADSDALDRQILRGRELRLVASRRQYKPREPMPEKCIGCGTKLRTKTSPKTPDARVHIGRGMCSTCYHRASMRGDMP